MENFNIRNTFLIKVSKVTRKYSCVSFGKAKPRSENDCNWYEELFFVRVRQPWILDFSSWENICRSICSKKSLKQTSFLYTIVDQRLSANYWLPLRKAIYFWKSVLLRSHGEAISILLICQRRIQKTKSIKSFKICLIKCINVNGFLNKYTIRILKQTTTFHLCLAYSFQYDWNIGKSLISESEW